MRLAGLQTLLDGPQAGRRFEDRYWVSATSGSSGRKSIIPSNAAEWSTIWTRMAGDVAAAWDQLAELLPVSERVVGPEHPSTLATRHAQTWMSEVLRFG